MADDIIFRGYDPIAINTDLENEVICNRLDKEIRQFPQLTMKMEIEVKVMKFSVPMF